MIERCPGISYLPEITHPQNVSMATTYPGTVCTGSSINILPPSNIYSGNGFIRSSQNGVDVQNLPMGTAHPGTGPVGALIRVT